MSSHQRRRQVELLIMRLSPVEGWCQLPAVFAPLHLRPTLIEPRGDIVARLLERFSSELERSRQSWNIKVWPQSLFLWGDFELLMLAYLRLGHFALRNSLDGGIVTLEFIQRGRMAECSMSYVATAETGNNFHPVAACSMEVCHGWQHPDTRLELCVVRYIAEAHAGWMWSDIDHRGLVRIAFALPEQASPHIG
jgi:hypothetical protein